MDKLYDTFFAAPRKAHVRVFSKQFIKIEFLDKYASIYKFNLIYTIVTHLTHYPYSLFIGFADPFSRNSMNGRRSL